MSVVHNRRTGFTMVELLVVMAIILVLTGLTFSIVRGVRQNQLRTQAQREVKDIAEAAKQYYQRFGVYPPDTGQFGTDLGYEDAAIHRYLGMPLTDKKTGQSFQALLQVQEKQLKGQEKEVDGVAARMFCDPWGNPYQLDAVHTKVTIETREVRRVGMPYDESTPDELQTLDVKVWSHGPDGKSKKGSYADGNREGEDIDNVTSW